MHQNKKLHNKAIARGSKMLVPDKVEMMMKKIAGVSQSAFLGMPDKELGEKAYALVELAEGSAQKKDEILHQVAKELKTEQIPFDYLSVVEHIPMDPKHRSKVEYGVLRKQFLKK